jgi:hypothetical protein
MAGLFLCLWPFLYAISFYSLFSCESIYVFAGPIPGWIVTGQRDSGARTRHRRQRRRSSDSILPLHFHFCTCARLWRAFLHYAFLIVEPRLRHSEVARLVRLPLRLPSLQTLLSRKRSHFSARDPGLAHSIINFHWPQLVIAIHQLREELLRTRVTRQKYGYLHFVNWIPVATISAQISSAHIQIM